MNNVVRNFRTSEGKRVTEGTQVEVTRFINGVDVPFAKISGEGFSFITTLSLAKKMTDYDK
tara:strand:+ start:192 stop:374 length:183 start_codon:yes stop_codon:yes gene_type:complete